MFTDIVSYSGMMQKNEALTLELLEEHRLILRPIFLKYGGREIETIGDAFFVEFDSAVQAANCALEIQKTLRARNAGVLLEKQIRLRIGLHVGDVVHVGSHVHGDKVNIAARIQPLVEPEGICISEDMARQIQNQIELPVVKLGKGELKNIQVPMDVYRVVMPWEKPSSEFSERLRFKLRQKRGQQAVLVVKALCIFTLFILEGLYIWQQMGEKRRDVTMESNLGTGLKPAPTQEVISLDKHRVAVLPFTNISHNPEDKYFADGMTEEMISHLSKIRDLRVIARTSVMAYKGTNKRIDEIGRELKVGTILEGSVRKAENQVRITAQLSDVESQVHHWSEDYDREMKGVFTIQSDIAKRVAEALKATLMAGEKKQIEKKGTENLEAYNLYLKGLYQMNKMTKEGLEKALEYFQQAIEKDPTYARAYAGIAFSYNWLGFLGYLSPKEAYPRSEAWVKKALEMDDTLAEAHTLLGALRTDYYWDWSGAESAFKQAIQLNPNYATAHDRYGYYYLSLMGRHDEAIAEMKRAQELDPVSLLVSSDLGWAFFWAQQYDQAIEQQRKTLEMDPNFYDSYWCLGFTYGFKGMYEEAIGAFQRMVDLTGGYSGVVADLGWAYAASGRRDKALKVLDELKERSKQEYVHPDLFA
jgi:TolB-like protein/Flp pilus assembly protein TadD